MSQVCRRTLKLLSGRLTKECNKHHRKSKRICEFGDITVIKKNTTATISQIYPIKVYTTKYFRGLSKWSVANCLSGKKHGSAIISEGNLAYVFQECYFFFMNLSINFNSFQGLKTKTKNQLCPRALQFKHHVIFLCCAYCIKLSKFTNPLWFSVMFVTFFS